MSPLPRAAFKDLRAAQLRSWERPSFRGQYRASKGASWPATTWASTICRGKLLPLEPAPWQITATLGATPGGYTGRPGRARKPYFTGVSRSYFKVAVGAVCCEPFSGQFACYLNEKFKIERQNEGRAISFRHFRALTEWRSNFVSLENRLTTGG